MIDWSKRCVCDSCVKELYETVQDIMKKEGIV